MIFDSPDPPLRDHSASERDPRQTRADRISKIADPRDDVEEMITEMQQQQAALDQAFDDSDMHSQVQKMRDQSIRMAIGSITALALVNPFLPDTSGYHGLCGALATLMNKAMRVTCANKCVRTQTKRSSPNNKQRSLQRKYVIGSCGTNAQSYSGEGKTNLFGTIWSGGNRRCHVPIGQTQGDRWCF